MAFDPAIDKMVLFGGAARSAGVWLRRGPTTGRRGRSGCPRLARPPGSTRRWRTTRRSARSCSSAVQQIGSGRTRRTYADTGPTTGPPGRRSTHDEPDRSEARRWCSIRVRTPRAVRGRRRRRMHADTWTYNGVTWTKQSPSTSPPARSNAAMAYDPASGNVVLFGGANSTDRTCTSRAVRRHVDLRRHQLDTAVTEDQPAGPQRCGDGRRPRDRPAGAVRWGLLVGRPVATASRRSTTRGRTRCARGRGLRRRSAQPCGRAARWRTTSKRARCFSSVE